MRRIATGGEPTALTDANRNSIRHDSWGAAITGPIRDALHTDQSGICVYCERTIPLAKHQYVPVAKIEHFHPRADAAWAGKSTRQWTRSACCTESAAGSHSASKTAWTNLLLACPGTVPHRPDGKTETTCDTSKAESDICAVFHNPKLTHLVQLVDVERDGRIRPVPGMPAGSEKVINDILRLNAPFLCAERQKTMARLYREYKNAKDRHHGLTPKQKRRYASQIRRQADQLGTEYPSSMLAVAKEIESRA